MNRNIASAILLATVLGCGQDNIDRERVAAASGPRSESETGTSATEDAVASANIPQQAAQDGVGAEVADTRRTATYGLGYDDQKARFPVLSGSTPDGRLAFASGSNDGSLLFVPFKQPDKGAPLARGRLDGWLYHSGARELRYTGGSAIGIDGHKFTVGFSNQAAIGFDPRYGLAPMRLTNAADCLADRARGFYQESSGTGELFCYKLIVYSAAARKKANGELDRKLFHNRLSLAVRSFRPNGTALDTPTIVGATFHGDYKPTFSRLGQGRTVAHHGLEVSVTADSRFLLWNAPALEGDEHVAIFTFSAEPWLADRFDEPVTLRDLYTAYSRKTACLTPADGGQNCKRIRLADHYKIARKPLREPYFGRSIYTETRTPNGASIPAVNPLFRCAYAWITPDGDNLFCSVNGLHQYIVGEDTKHILYPLDGAINGFHKRSGYNSGPNESMVYQGRNINGENTFGGFKSVREKRIEMPIFVGQDAGLWRAFATTGAPAPINEARRSHTFHMLLRHGKLEVFDPIRKVVMAKDQPQTGGNVASFVYQPVSLDSFTTGDYLFFHHFQSVRPFVGQEQFDRGYLREVGKSLVDASGNFNNLRLTSALAEEDLASTRVNDFDHYYTNEGYQGQGLHLAIPNGSAHVIPSATSATSRSRDALTVEIAFKLQPGAKASRLPLARIGSLELALSGQRVQLVDRALGASQDIVTLADSVAIKTGTWYHVGATVATSGGNRRYSIYLDGRRVAQKIVAAKAGISINVTAGALATLGPAGDCIGCSGKIVLDEFAVATAERGPDYFAVAALLPPDAGAPTRLYPFELPKSLSKEDLYIPPALQLGSLTNEQRVSLARLGSRLFHDQVLSTSASNKTQNVSCASCHDSARAFTDGRTLSKGINALDLNAPTLINRATAKGQLFDKRSPSLFNQSLDPVTHPDEMNGHIPTILTRISANGSYMREFRSIFGSNVSLDGDHLRKALAMYVLSITSGDAPVDLPARRSDIYERGRELFFGKARCTSCHNGVNFTDEVVRNSGLGRSVKTPTLREIANTGPYFHDGRAATLEDVVRFYNDPPVNTPGIDSDLRPIGLTEPEVLALTTFLRSAFDGEVRFAK